MANHLGKHMNTTIRKGKTLFYGDHTFSHGLSRSGHFTLKEAEFLESYGHTLSGLANATITPENEEEQIFVTQLNEEGESTLLAAKIWKKYLKAIEKSKVGHSFSKSSGRTLQDMGNDFSLAD
jgi:hypothetical protein